MRRLDAPSARLGVTGIVTLGDQQAPSQGRDFDAGPCQRRSGGVFVVCG